MIVRQYHQRGRRQRGCRQRVCHGRFSLAGLLVLLAAVFSCPALAITAEDGLGREVVLEEPARRIVALAPHIVENLFSAGAGEHLVGVVSYSDWPGAARDIPRVGTFNAFSLEQIAALQPDLVVMWGSGNGARALEKLQRLSVPVYVSELRRIEDIPRDIRQLGRLAGTRDIAEREAARLEQGFARLAANYRNRRPLKVFYQIWHEPLQTISGEHLISEVLALCGGQNLFADASGLAPRISLEAVLAGDPDVIVAGGMQGQRREWLDYWQQFPQLRAVRHEGLLPTDPDLLQRPTARLLTGATRLCRDLEAARATAPPGGPPSGPLPYP